MLKDGACFTRNKAESEGKWSSGYRAVPVQAPKAASVLSGAGRQAGLHILDISVVNCCAINYVLRTVISRYMRGYRPIHIFAARSPSFAFNYLFPLSFSKNCLVPAWFVTTKNILLQYNVLKTFILKQLIQWTYIRSHDLQVGEVTTYK